MTCSRCVRQLCPPLRRSRPVPSPLGEQAACGIRADGSARPTPIPWLTQRAAAADEPPELNFVRKHAQAMQAQVRSRARQRRRLSLATLHGLQRRVRRAVILPLNVMSTPPSTRAWVQGLTNPAARLFSNPAGDYGSMVNERVSRACCARLHARLAGSHAPAGAAPCSLASRTPQTSVSATALPPPRWMHPQVGAGNWEGGDELGTTWASRNAFSYGRGGERGTARPEVLQVSALL